jgi:membrane-associated protein
LNVLILEALQHYGYPALALIIFVAAVGAPISGNVLLYAAGAFAAFGDFNVFILLPVAVSSAVLGDNLGYYIGRRAGTALLAWFARQKRFRFITPQSLARGRAYLKKRTGWAIFLTRWLIVVLGGPINFLAGIDDYPYLNFLFCDISGQILGAAIPLGLGYIFAESWEEVADILGDFSGLLLALLVALVIVALVVRRVRRNRKASIEVESAAEVSTLPISDASSHNGALSADATPSLHDALPPVEGTSGQHSTGPLPIPLPGEPT